VSVKVWGYSVWAGGWGYEVSEGVGMGVDMDVGVDVAWACIWAMA
jgi:hypothetical protein